MKRILTSLIIMCTIALGSSCDTDPPPPLMAFFSINLKVMNAQGDNVGDELAPMIFDPSDEISYEFIPDSYSASDNVLAVYTSAFDQEAIFSFRCTLPSELQPKIITIRVKQELIFGDSEYHTITTNWHYAGELSGGEMTSITIDGTNYSFNDHYTTYQRL